MLPIYAEPATVSRTGKLTNDFALVLCHGDQDMHRQAIGVYMAERSRFATKKLDWSRSVIYTPRASNSPVARNLRTESAPQPSEQIQRSILNLRARVQAAREVFDVATACHEAWKPTAYDADLHARIGRSFAANTFRTVRLALRREMLLALMRMWDTQDDAIRMTSVASSLDDMRVVNALAIECETSRMNQPIHHCSEGDELPDTTYDTIVSKAFAREDSVKLRHWAAEAVALIRKYAEVGSEHDVVKKLGTLRNKRLAHHEVRISEDEVIKATPTDDEIEAFYQDMSKLIHLLCLAVQDVHYDPEETASIRRKHAVLFWAGVRGERTVGHPDYRPLVLSP
jgi:hypothetical protein